MSRILITGAGGFLGKHVQKAFEDSKYTIYTPNSKELNLIDCNSVDTINEYKPDIILHMAAVCGGILANKNSPADFLRDNTQMALNIYEAARVANVKLVYSLGTVCMYPKYCPVPFREDDIWNGYPEETNAPYSQAKRTLLMLGQTYRQQYGIGGAHLIPVNMYGECFSHDTEIATTNGLLNIKNIKIGDKVYTLNPHTHEVEIEDVIATQINKTNQFINFNGSVIDLRVTPNHKIYYKTNAKFQKKKAAVFIPRAGKKHGMIRFATNKKLTTDIKYNNVFSMKNYIDEGHEIRNNKVRDHKHSHSHWIPIEYNIEDICQFVGWYVSEGSRIEGGQISISQRAVVNDKNREEIRQLLTRMSIPFGEDNERFYFSSRLWRNFVEKETGIGCYNKQIPSFMMKLPANLLQIIFDSLMRGDGDKDGERYTTTSTKLKDQLIILIMLLGKLPGKIYKETSNNSSYWRIHIRQIRANSVKYKNIKIEDVENEDVYCITTEKNHIVYAGRNNKFCWVGQCDHFDLTNSHVIPALINKFVNATYNNLSSVECWGTGTATREFLNVKDCAVAIAKTVNMNLDTNLPINLGVGEDISIYDLAHLIAKLSGYSGEITFNGQFDGQPKRLLDVSRAKELLNWKAQISLEAGLKETIEWYRAQS